MKQIPYFPFYQQDFLGSLDVKMMTAEEIGCYCLLIFNCYNNNGILPDDLDKLTALCQGTKPTQEVFKKFYKKGNFLRHKRVDHELRKYAEKSEVASANAKKRWDKAKDKVCGRNAGALPTQCKGNANQNQNQNQNHITPQPPLRGDDDFKNLEIKHPKLLRWIKTFEHIKNPSGFYYMLTKKYPGRIIEWALNQTGVVSPSEFQRFCEFKLTQK